jgi:murein DD-endopeptidase MepM/ murein hydrolase activator NlpD
VFYTLSLSITAFIFFGALVYLQNRLIDTPIEKSLRDENRALRQHKNEIKDKLASANVLIASIEKNESVLHQKLFDVKLESVSKETRNPNMLGIDATKFNDHLVDLTEKLNLNLTKAQTRNQHFSKYSSLKKEDLAEIAAFPSRMPLEDLATARLVSGFGPRINPWHKGKYEHNGVDFAAARGTTVVATGTGQVRAVKESTLQAGYGNYVEIDHGWGFITRYAHLGEIAVRPGQKVSKGQAIGAIGISGGSVAPHVHYEVLKNGKSINPMHVLVEGLDAKQFQVMAEASRKLNQSLD